MNKARILVCAISIGLSGVQVCTVHASQLSIEIPLSNVAVTRLPDFDQSHSASILSVGGTFNVPLLDPAKFQLNEIAIDLTVDLGGAGWTSIISDTFFASVATRIDFTNGIPYHYPPTINGSGGSSFGETVQFDAFRIFDDTDPVNFRSGSALDAGGYVPLSAGFAVVANAVFLGGSGPAASMAFVTAPHIDVTYMYDALSADGGASLPVGGLAEFAVFTGPGDANQLPPPPGLLPPYVIAPEPSTLALAAFGGLAWLVLRRRR